MSRRVWVVLLGLSLVVFLFEGAVHSVHHLDSDREATACWVAGAASSISLIDPDAVVLDELRPALVGALVALGISAPIVRPLGAVRERAPPPVLSA